MDEPKITAVLLLFQETGGARILRLPLMRFQQKSVASNPLEVCARDLAGRNQWGVQFRPTEAGKAPRTDDEFVDLSRGIVV